jgi:hypothetical protein
MPGVEVTDSIHHTNDRHRPANEKKEEKRITIFNIAAVQPRLKWRQWRQLHKRYNKINI